MLYFKSAMAAVGLAVACTACSTDVGTSSKNENFAYDYNFNGCETGKQEFSSKADYCAALKNDAANHFCARETRKTTYTNECGADFPADDTSSSTTFSSRPALPPVPPQPLRPVVSRWPAVGQELEAAGIQIEVPRSRLPDLPGRPNHEDLLKQFWITLDANKAEILKRKSVIKSLVLKDWAGYNEANRTLSLHIGFSSQLLQRYLLDFDRRLAWEQSTGIQIIQSIDLFDADEDGFVALENGLSAFDTHKAVLTSLNVLIRWIDLDFTTSGCTLLLSEHKLMVDDKRVPELISTFAADLGKAAPFFQFLKANAVEWTGSYLLAKDQTNLGNLAQRMGAEKGDLATLISLGGLKSIEFLENASSLYNFNQPTLRVGLDNDNSTLAASVIKAMASQYSKAKDLGLNITNTEPIGNLSDAYVEEMRRLDARYDVIRAKKAKISSIGLGGSSQFMSGILYIGSGGSLADLDKVLAQIK